MRKNIYHSIILISIICVLISTSACSAKPPAGKMVREPAVAGSFYPENPAVLKERVDTLLQKAPTHQLKGRLKALFVPHAGYAFSGSTAAEGIKTIGRDWQTIILLGPSHHVNFKGAALYSRGAFQTPLGAVPIDEKTAAALLKNTALFHSLPKAHEKEHCLEVQLPFLQRFLKDFAVVPILTNTHKLKTLRKIGQEIAKVAKDRKILIIISGDLSHYPNLQTADAVDRTFLRALETMDPSYIQLTSGVLLGRKEPNLNTTCCGLSPLLAGLYAAKSLGADQAQILKYTNSGENKTYGDTRRVVGYAAAALIKTGQAPAHSIIMNQELKQTLLKTARASLQEAFDKTSYQEKALSQNPELNLPAAVFMTLFKNKRLRGCIGTTTPRSSLLEAVRYFARAAAFEDPRFSALKESELKDVHIEISILSSPQPISDPDVIEPFKHGVIVEKGYHAGLFLPTVWDHLPDKENFMGELCAQKAGLPRNAWKNDPDVKLSVFTTEVFEE